MFKTKAIINIKYSEETCKKKMQTANIKRNLNNL